MSPVRVISIGSDRALFEPTSDIRLRAVAYAEKLGELHVIVFTLQSHQLEGQQVGSLHMYPTNSRSKLKYIFDAAKLARRLPGELITVQDPFESGLAGLLGRKKKPLHVQLHTDPFTPAFATTWLNRVRLVMARIVLPRAARIRVVSNALAEKLRVQYPHTPVSVLPIFVDVKKYQSVEKKPHSRFKTTLLWIGRFEREKNPALAIRALAEARRAGHEAGLVMLGTGNLDAQLGQLAEDLGVSDWVEFAGWQDPEKFLGMADLLLVTSAYEGYGRQIIEALAAGVPVLSTEVGIAREAGALITTENDFTVVVVPLGDVPR